jgi:hypothetical protein
MRLSPLKPSLGKSRRSSRRLFLEQLEDRRVMTQDIYGFGSADTYEGYSPSTIGYDFERYGDTSQALTVYYSVSGGATSGEDFQVPSGTFTFGVNESVYYLRIPAYDDDILEGDEYVVFTITPSIDYDTPGGNTFVSLIEDNETAPDNPSEAIPGCPGCPPVAADAFNSAANSRLADAGVLHTFAPSGFSSNPVRYSDGVVLVSSTDLESSGFGMPWGITRQWSNGVGYARENVVGSGMVVSQQPVIFQADGTNTIGVVVNGHTVRYFDLVGGAYEARHFSQEKLVYESTTREYVLTLTSGAELRFYGFDTWTPSTGYTPGQQRGRFKSFSDEFGNSTAVVSHAANGTIQEVQRSYTVGGVTTVESFFYTYVSSGDNKGLIESVVLRRKVGAGAWIAEREVEYTYYGTSDTYGNLGDLELATIKDGSNNILDQTYYRYYKPSESNGYVHGLKYVVEPASFARLVAAEGNTLDSISNNALAPFANYYFEYDGDQRATREVAQGAGSTANDGLGEFTFSYSLSGNPEDYNSWDTKTVETLPDGNQNIIFTNYVGQVMLEVFKDTTTSDEWVTYYKYDDDGRLVMVANPSAVTGYDEYAADLLDYDTTDYTYLHDTEGLIKVFEYYTSTTATTSVAGAASGYLESVSIRKGESGTDVPQSLTTYIEASNGLMSNYLPAEVTSYTNTNGTGALTTSYEYTFYSSTLRVESIETTTPAGDVSTVFYDTYGNAVWVKDEEGYLHYAAYDIKTGALLKTIADVDSTETGDFANKPSGWTTPGGAGIHAITTYEVDGQGRATKETDAEGRVTYTVYNDANHEARIYAGWDTGTDTPTGPTIVIREDRAGSYVETLTMSAAPTAVADKPTGAEAISAVKSLARTFINSGGQAFHTDEYFLVAGLTYTVGASLGCPFREPQAGFLRWAC